MITGLKNCLKYLYNPHLDIYGIKETPGEEGWGNISWPGVAPSARPYLATP